MKVSLVSMNISWMNIHKNIEQIKRYTKKAKENGCKWVIFPEMSTTGFSMKARKLTTLDALQTDESIASISSSEGMNIIIGYPRYINSNSRAYNSAVIFDSSGKITASYEKIHLFSLAKENNYFTSGKSPIIFNIGDISSSIFICYDLRFPELFRMVAKNIQCAVVIANWPQSRASHWHALLQARAIENQILIIGVNRSGIDGNKLEYNGDSLVFYADGTQKKPISDENKLLVFDIDTSYTQKIRDTLPFLEDMKLLPEI